MAAQLLLRFRSSPSSSPAYFLSNLSTFYRSFSAASTRKIILPTDYASKLSEARRSEHWEDFKSWMSNHQKCCRTDKEIFYRFTVFSHRLNCIEKFKNELCEAKCSKEWEVFESWMFKNKKKYKNDKHILYGFNIFTQRMYGFGVSALNRFSDLTFKDPHAIGKMSYSMLAQVIEGLRSEEKEWIRFGSWMSIHEKKYKSNKEMMHRYRTFKECLKNIKKANEENPGCMFELNGFSDLTSEELPPRKSSFSKLSGWAVCLYELVPALPVSRWMPFSVPRKKNPSV